MRRAAIDIGTVSTRLLVADVHGTDVTEVQRITTITHLGEDLTETGRLKPEAVRRVLDAVGGFVQDARALRTEEMVTVATSAARDAENSDEFLHALRGLGVEPRIIAGDEEARLSFEGAVSSMEGEGILVADIGGGSTELILGSVDEDDGRRCQDIGQARSIDVGSRRLTELFLKSDPPAQEEMQRAAQWAVEQFRPFFDALRDERPRTMVAVAGTATSLSALKLGLVEYDPEKVHMSCLSGGDVTDLKDELASMTLARRRELPGLDPGRASVIVAGAMILEALVALAGLDSTLVSEHDILYGLVLEGGLPAAE